MQTKKTKREIAFPAVAIVLGLAALSAAQPVSIPYHKEAYVLESGRHTNTEAETATPFSQVVSAPGAAWMQVHISEYNLGPQSYITITSALDGGRQRHNANSLKDWQNMSAAFNGDSVLVELHAAPGEEGNFIQIDEIVVGEFVGGEPPPDYPESICGATDNRTASNDVRVGRLVPVGCTAWLISNGTILTAGHCVDLDPDRDGPMLPDGVLDLSGRVEFDVPASLSDGTLVASAPEDQFPVSTTNVRWRFDGEGQGLGKDWAVFRCQPNTNGVLPHIDRGAFFRMTNLNPSAGNTIRITGHGIDNIPAGSTGGRNAQNQTQQTHAGPYVSENSSGADIWHRYQVDTEGGNSGSPIIWTANGFTVGIHTNAGCGDDGSGGISGANNGTSFEVNALETAMQTYWNNNTRYVDLVSAAPASDDGTIYRPYDTVTAGVNSVPNGGLVSIVTGTYTSAAGNTFLAGEDGKGFSLFAPVGSVLIGN